jgi:hypothetical protein
VTLTQRRGGALRHAEEERGREIRPGRGLAMIIGI